MKEINQGQLYVEYDESTGDASVFKQQKEVMHILLEPDMSEDQVKELIFSELPIIPGLDIFNQVFVEVCSTEYTLNINMG